MERMPHRLEHSHTREAHDDYDRVLGIEHKHIALVPEGEREEIRQIFEAKGFTGDDLDRLMTVITSDRALWAKTMATEEYGLSPTLRSPRLAALATFAAFIICGCLPLLSYLLPQGFYTCVPATGERFSASARSRAYGHQPVGCDPVWKYSSSE
jgi:VIT1/CCC1 family predicted Fe2+/Mn2+ transporter